MADNYPQALAALDKVRALGAEAPGHYFLRAIMLDKMKDLKPALVLLAHAGDAGAAGAEVQGLVGKIRAIVGAHLAPV